MSDINKEMGKLIVSDYASKKVAPLSHGQRRLNFIHNLKPGNSAYNISRALRLKGDVNVDSLIKSLNEIVRRHESLRTSFQKTDGENVQVISPFSEFQLPFQDFSDLPDDQVDGNINRVIEEERNISFNLAEGNLFRFKLYKIRQNDYLFIITFHHIVTDGWSMRVFYNELSALYNAFVLGKNSPLDELSFQYADFAKLQKLNFENKKQKLQVDYWKQKLKNFPELHQLPTDFLRPNEQTFEGDRVCFEMDNHMVESIKSVCEKTGSTIYMVLLTAYSILLSKYSNTSDIIIGSPVASRNKLEIEPLIGFFVNTIPLRIQIPDEITFSELFLKVRATVFEAFGNQDATFDQIVEELQPSRSLSHSPIIQLIFAYHNLPDVNLNLSGVTAEFVPTDKINTDNDLEIHLNQNQKGINGYFVYNKSLFHKTRIERMAGHFVNILKSLSSVNQKVCDINLLSEEETHYIIHDLNSSFIDYPRSKSVYELFEEQVSKTPNSDAVVFKDQKISYGDLNDRASRLAFFLQENGAEKEEVIALMLHRSIEMMVGLYGILKSGCAYLPIDPEYPQDRINYMLENSNAKILITDDGLRKRVSNSKMEIINIYESKIFENQTLNLKKDFSKNLAYLIYTSGSTGIPKGIMVEHKNVVNFITGVTNKISFESGKTILSLTTISFDIFVLETLLALSKGLRVVLGSPEEQMDPAKMVEAVHKHNVEMLQFTPSRLKMVLDSGKGQEIFGTIKELMVGGEAFPLDLLKELKKIYRGRIFNMYGPTETTVWSTIKELTNEESISLGEPIANTQIYILDKNNTIKPLGVQGELCIGGDGVARGYWRQDELTREKFINSPFIEGERIYKTGDLARRKYDGTLEFLGRLDDQVKIRGYRIELSEIEHVLLDHENIDAAAVVVKDDSNNNKILCAYYVSENDLFADELREFLLKKLPGYMVPSYFIRLEKMPMTSNGKIDKKALPEFSREKLSLTNNYEEPKNISEKTIIDIWKEILNLQSVGVNDNFFDVGGHSLLIAKLTSLMKIRTGIVLDDMDIFRYPTIRLISNNFAKLPEEDERKNSSVNTGESKKILLDKILGNRKNK